METISTKKALTFLTILFLGAGVALVTHAWEPLWSPFRLSPEVVLGSMIMNTKHATTNYFEWDIRADFLREDTKEKLLQLSLRIDGDLDVQDENNEKSQGTLDLAMHMEGIDYAAKMEYRGLGDKAYFRFKTFPALPFLGLEGGGSDALRNQWFVTEKGAQDPEQEEKIKQKVEVVWEDIVKDPSLYVIQELPDTRVGKKATYHYRITLKENGVERIISGIFDALASLPVLDLERNEIDARSIASKLGEITAEVFVGKSDRLVYRYFIQKDIDIDQFLPFNFLSESEASTFVSLEFDMELSDYGKKFSVEPPPDAKPLEEFFGPTSLGGLGEAREAARDAKRQADIRQISVAMELCYDNSECGGGGQYLATRGGPNAVKAIEPFLQSVPTDPTDDFPYQYTWMPNYFWERVDDYCLYARLEEDSQISGRVVYIAAGPNGVRKRDMPNTAAFSLTNCE